MEKVEKRRRYSKAELDLAKATGDKKIIGELAGRLMDGELMSVAETNFAASVLRATRVAGSISFIDLASIPAAQDFIFKNLYILYHSDLEGKYGIDKPFGIASSKEKRGDVIRLNEYYHEWKKVYSKNNHNGNPLLNLVINESNNEEYKELKEMFKRGEINQGEFDYKEKSIVLHSKYLYLTAKAFFDEHQSDEVVAKFHSKEIVINEYSLVHILNRHLGGVAKQFNTNKSFHLDREIKWFELPYNLKLIIENLGTHPDTDISDLKFLPFKFNGIIYAMWTEHKTKHQAGRSIPIIRLQSCYPVEDSLELKKIQTRYREVPINEKLSAFVAV